MAPFDIREVRELMEDDELELDTIGDEKTALFLIMSDTDTTFNFILAMVQSQLINLLCDRADDKYGGRLPVHVRMILDEFANIGQIPNFDKLIATIRSREISASIILQSQSQLKAIYKDAAEIISDNCDCTLFLSGRGKNAKEISDVLGKETIDSYNQSENRGAQTSHGLNYQKLGKEVPSKMRKQNFEKLASAFQMGPHLNNLISSYSHGMKQKLALIAAFSHTPKLLILDEPFVGLDPEAFVILKEQMKELCASGNSVLFSSHILDVVEKVCNKVSVIKHGQLLYSGRTTEIVGTKGLEEVFMEMNGDEISVTPTKE